MHVCVYVSLFHLFLLNPIHRAIVDKELSVYAYNDHARPHIYIDGDNGNESQHCIIMNQIRSVLHKIVHY